MRNHKDVYAVMVAFRDYMSKKCERIAVQLNSLHAAQIKRNREVFKSIIATMELCAHVGHGS